MELGYHTITWGGVFGDAQGVTSVKDLHYRTAGSVRQALRDIADAGYTGTELFDGDVADLGPHLLRDALAETGLTLVSVYTGANFVYDEILPDELDKVTRACALAQAAGAERLVVGGGARRANGTTEQDYDRLAAALDRVTDLAADHGLTATYHPHLTTIVESPSELEQLLPRTRIGFCPDTAHLAGGGGDPAALIRRYADRIRHVHLKDLRREPFGFLPLGQGELDFSDVLQAVQESGYDSWLMVELDSYDGDPAEAARISKQHLDGLLDELGLSVTPTTAADGRTTTGASS